MPRTKRKDYIEPAGNDSLFKSLHKSYRNIPPALSTVFWIGAGYVAFETIKKYQSQGFFNDVVLVPIVEEVLHRLVVHGVIEKTQQIWNRVNKTKMDETSTQNRVIMASVLFGIAHFDSSLDTITQTFWNLGRGCGYLYEETGSLAPPIALHISHNFIAETTLRSFVRQEFTYPFLFYALGKKMFPIPDFVTKPIISLASKISTSVVSVFK